MIVEVRIYCTRPDRRAEFIRVFTERTAPAQRAHGIRLVGPLLDVDNPDRFVWLRMFPSAAERDRMKAAFYESHVWKAELEPIVMPMLESYQVMLCDAGPEYTADQAFP